MDLTQPIGDLPIQIMPWQVLYVMALFCVLVFVLNRTLLRPIHAVLDERARRIDEGRGAADDSSEKIAERERQIVERLAKARSEAVAKLDAAKAQAEETRRGKVEAARQAADARISEATAAVEKAAAEAEKSLETEAEHFGRRIASRLLGREVA